MLSATIGGLLEQAREGRSPAVFARRTLRRNRRFFALPRKAITLRNDAFTPYPSKFAEFTPALQARSCDSLSLRTLWPTQGYNPSTGRPLRGPASTVAPRLEKIVRLPGTKAVAAELADCRR